MLPQSEPGGRLLLLLDLWNALPRLMLSEQEWRSSGSCHSALLLLTLLSHHFWSGAAPASEASAPEIQICLQEGRK